MNDETSKALREDLHRMKTMREANAEIDANLKTAITGSINHRPDLDTMKDLIGAKIIRIDMTQDQTDLILKSKNGDYYKLKLDRKF